MKFLNYKCPECDGRMQIRLLHSVDVCSTCHVEVQLTPDPIKNKLFLPFNLICSLLIGWGIGEIRMSSGEVFGYANLCADVFVYLIFFAILRAAIFQFQTPEILRSDAVSDDDARDV